MNGASTVSYKIRLLGFKDQGDLHDLHRRPASSTELVLLGLGRVMVWNLTNYPTKVSDSPIRPERSHGKKQNRIEARSSWKSIQEIPML